MTETQTRRSAPPARPKYTPSVPSGKRLRRNGVKFVADVNGEYILTDALGEVRNKERESLYVRPGAEQIAVKYAMGGNYWTPSDEPANEARYTVVLVSDLTAEKPVREQRVRPEMPMMKPERICRKWGSDYVPDPDGGDYLVVILNPADKRFKSENQIEYFVRHDRPLTHVSKLTFIPRPDRTDIQRLYYMPKGKAQVIDSWHKLPNIDRAEYIVHVDDITTEYQEPIKRPTT